MTLDTFIQSSLRVCIEGQRQPHLSKWLVDCDANLTPGGTWCACYDTPTPKSLSIIDEWDTPILLSNHIAANSGAWKKTQNKYIVHFVWQDPLPEDTPEPENEAKPLQKGKAIIKRTLSTASAAKTS